MHFVDIPLVAAGFTEFVRGISTSKVLCSRGHTQSKSSFAVIICDSGVLLPAAGRECTLASNFEMHCFRMTLDEFNRGRRRRSHLRIGRAVRSERAAHRVAHGEGTGHGLCGSANSTHVRPCHILVGARLSPNSSLSHTTEFKDNRGAAAADGRGFGGGGTG